jgi:hypothetical protein
VIVESGRNETLPEVRPPVVKFVPVQDKAPEEDQVRVVDWPAKIVMALAEKLTETEAGH